MAAAGPAAAPPHAEGPGADGGAPQHRRTGPREEACLAPAPPSADSDPLDADAELVYDYLQMHHEPAPSDAIVCLGSSDLRVATYAAELFLRGLAPVLVFSGGVGSGPHSGRNLLGWTRPEAEVMADEAARCGVPRDRMLVEPLSRNSGENIRFTAELLRGGAARELLEAAAAAPAGAGGGARGAGGGGVRSLLVVQKPFMERRAYATFMKQWPAGPGGGGGHGASSGTGPSGTLDSPGPLAGTVRGGSEADARDTANGGSGGSSGDGAAATARAWPLPSIRMASPPLSLSQYCEGTPIARADTLAIMVGDLQRIRRYAEPPHEFQIAQEVPVAVWAAGQRLAAAGHTGNLIGGVW